jgi:hypothetical protein
VRVRPFDSTTAPRAVCATSSRFATIRCTTTRWSGGLFSSSVLLIRSCSRHARARSSSTQFATMQQRFIHPIYRNTCKERFIHPSHYSQSVNISRFVHPFHSQSSFNISRFIHPFHSQQYKQQLILPSIFDSFIHPIRNNTTSN